MYERRLGVLHTTYRYLPLYLPDLIPPTVAPSQGADRVYRIEHFARGAAVRAL